MKKANRSSKIINFKDFNTGYNAVSEREDNIIGKKIADFRAANKMSLTDLRIPVSYTHLDVYKRQLRYHCFFLPSSNFSYGNSINNDVPFSQRTNAVVGSCLLYTSRCV